MSDSHIPAISAILDSGALVEMVFRPSLSDTCFVVYENGHWHEETVIDLPSGRRLVPYSPENNLIQHHVVAFPSEPLQYGSEADLLSEIRSFIHRYVDLPPLFEEISSYYVLFTWIYDAFNEVPYLRVRGDYGSGKSRFLLTVGTLCYKAIFASGASTVSPIFRIIDAFRGTLVIDESDFRVSDEKAEIVKILNNGNARGFPVLRSEVNQKREYDPRAYSVFGPKLIATRGAFEDRALESRCLSEEMGTTRVRKDIPINLPAAFHEEAAELRNKLLLFRFRNLRRPRDLSAVVDQGIEPRLSQILTPLLSVVDDPRAAERFRAFGRSYNRELVSERGSQIEGQVLEVIRDLAAAGAALTVKDIATAFGERFQGDYSRQFSPRAIGAIIRKRLSLKPQKSHGVFVLPAEELSKLPRLLEKYGLS